MLIVIERVLDPDEVAAFREKLSGADWIDGAQTAGSRSVAVKQNLQLDRGDPLAVELGNTILRKLGTTRCSSPPRWPRRSSRRCSTSTRTAGITGRMSIPR